MRLLADRARGDADGLDRRRVGHMRHDEQCLDRHRPRPARRVARVGHRVGRLADDLDHGEHAPPTGGVVHEPVARCHPRAAREAGAREDRRAPVGEPRLGQRGAGVADALRASERARGKHAASRAAAAPRGQARRAAPSARPTRRRTRRRPAGSNCVPAQRSSSASASAASAPAIGAVGDHRVEGIADGRRSARRGGCARRRGRPGSPCRPSARGWSGRASATPASAGAARRCARR